ncbi:MAG: PsiF family protein [Burkholderiales bacterium]
MKNFIIATFIALVASVPAMAATQQEKMRTCNAEARSQSLKGEDRRAFMSQCLSVTPEEKQERLAAKEKVKSCNAEARAKSIKGEERKQFIAQCLAA